MVVFERSSIAWAICTCCCCASSPLRWFSSILVNRSITCSLSLMLAPDFCEPRGDRSNRGSALPRRKPLVWPRASRREPESAFSRPKRSHRRLHLSSIHILLEAAKLAVDEVQDVTHLHIGPPAGGFVHPGIAALDNDAIAGVVQPVDVHHKVVPLGV